MELKLPMNIYSALWRIAERSDRSLKGLIVDVLVAYAKKQDPYLPVKEED